MDNGAPRHSVSPQHSHRFALSPAAKRRLFRCVRFLGADNNAWIGIACGRVVTSPRLHRIPECLSREPKMELALRDAVARVVVALDLAPVVAPAELARRGDAKPASVIRDCRLADAEGYGDLGEAKTGSKQLNNPLSVFRLSPPSVARTHVRISTARQRRPAPFDCGYPFPSIAGSSNGKTSGSGPENRGSNPCPAVTTDGADRAPSVLNHPVNASRTAFPPAPAVSQ
jgi:hypothetical protein